MKPIDACKPSASQRDKSTDNVGFWLAACTINTRQTHSAWNQIVIKNGQTWWQEKSNMFAATPQYLRAPFPSVGRRLFHASYGFISHLPWLQRRNVKFKFITLIPLLIFPIECKVRRGWELITLFQFVMWILSVGEQAGCREHVQSNPVWRSSTVFPWQVPAGRTRDIWVERQCCQAVGSEALRWYRVEERPFNWKHVGCNWQTWEFTWFYHAETFFFVPVCLAWQKDI